MRRNLIVCSPFEPDLNFSRAVAGALAIEFRKLELRQIAETVASEPQPPLLFLGVSNADELERCRCELLPLTQSAVGPLSPDSIHLIGDARNGQLAQILGRFPVGSFIHRSGEDFRIAAQKFAEHHLASIVSTPANGPDIERTLWLAGKFSKSILLSHSSQKEPALEGVADFLDRRLPMSCATRRHVVNAVDELLMNAIHDSERGARPPRSASFVLPPSRPVQLKLESNGEYLRITVTDLNGTLRRSRIMSHVLRDCGCLMPTESSESGGFGIGLALTFRMGGSLIFVCDRDERTSATVVFQHLGSLRQFREQSRFVAVRMRGSGPDSDCER